MKPKRDPNRPTVPEVVPLIKKLYERGTLGCCYYTILENPNYSQAIAEECLRDAIRLGHKDCIEAGEKIIQLTPTQRKSLGDKVDYGWMPTANPGANAEDKS